MWDLDDVYLSYQQSCSWGLTEQNENCIELSRSPGAGKTLRRSQCTLNRHTRTYLDARDHAHTQPTSSTACLKATFQFYSSRAEIGPLSVDRSVPVGFRSVLFWSQWSASFLSPSQSLCRRCCAAACSNRLQE